MELSDHNSGSYGSDRPMTVLVMPLFHLVDRAMPEHVPQLIDNPHPCCARNSSATGARSACTATSLTTGPAAAASISSSTSASTS